MSDEELIQKSRDAAANAYCKYSQFPVGAAVVAEDGQVYLGCNIENASYGLTACAERTAIFNAISAGNRRIKRIGVTCLNGDPSDPGSLMPCGACRQVISEFMENDGTTLVDGVASFTLDELLPLRFKLPQ